MKDGQGPGGGASCPAEESLGGLLDQVAAIARHEDNPSLDSVMTAFGPRGALPLMIVVALVIVSPLSGIPLLSSLGGLTIAAIALQLALGRRRLWLPGWLSRRSIPRPRLLAALDRLRPTAGFLDRHCRRRLWFMTTPPVSQAVLLVCALAGLTMPVLELVPFSSSLLAMAVTCLGFSLLTRDGLWAALALVPLAGAVWVLSGLVG